VTYQTRNDAGRWYKCVPHRDRPCNESEWDTERGQPKRNNYFPPREQWNESIGYEVDNSWQDWNRLRRGDGQNYSIDNNGNPALIAQIETDYGLLQRHVYYTEEHTV